MTDDLYAGTRGLIDELCVTGLSEGAQRLADVMDDGFTATEVLMGIRWYLTLLEEELGGTRSAVYQRILELRRKVDNAPR